MSPNQQINYSPIVKIDIIDGVYDLLNRQPKQIYNIKSGGIYIFYVPAKEEQKVNIKLTTNYTTNNPFNKLEISEYLLRENNFDDKVTKNQSIANTTKTSNNELISSFTYTVLPDIYSPYYHNYNLANYIALKIIPSNITYLIVQIDVLSIDYNLNKDYIGFTNLNADTTYSFYMNIDKYQKGIFQIEMNNMNMNEQPLKFVTIYEYADNSYAYEEKENKTIFFSSKNNKFIASFSYILKSKYKKTNCIFISIKPLLDIIAFKIKKEIIGGVFELSPRTSIDITNLKIGGPYYFLIKTEKFQNITFNVVMDNINTKSFETVDINEYDYLGIKQSDYIKTTQKKISFSSSNNQLISTFSYLVSKEYNRETALNIIPKSDINYMNIKIQIENTFYNFYSEEETIYNLTVGNIYYLYKQVYGQGMKILYLNIIMDYRDDNPFGPIKVYEHKGEFSNDNKDDSLIKYPDIKINKKNGLFLMSSSYKIVDKYFISVVYELSPNYNINCLKVKYGRNYYDIGDNFVIPKLYIYILIAIVIIMFLIVAICIINRNKTSKNKDEYYSSIEQSQNLIPPES